MFTEHSWIDIFFRFVNMGVLVALLLYLFKRYGIDAITQGMREQERHKKELADQQEMLARQQVLTELAAREQQLLAQRLEKNVHIWRAQFAVFDTLRAQEKEIVRDALRRKSAIQQQQLAADTIAHQVLARACQQARDQVRVQFADEQVGKAFVRDIVASLKTRCL